MLRHMFRIAALLLSAGLATVASADQPSGQRSVEDVQKIVREYLLKNPEVIFEAVQRHRENQQRLQADRDRAAVKQHAKELLADPDSFVGGNPDGDVTLVEFFDYRCGYCKRFASVLANIMKQDPKLRVVYKEFPVLGEDSFRAAQAALAARGQGYYLEFHEALMKANGPLTDAAIMTVARSVGLDVERLKRDMETPKVLNIISNNRRLATALQVDGTPTLVVGDLIVRGAVPIRDLTAMIAQARAKGS
ncbi:MAG: DsbA family protein [Deltaproteobacteria bacterium]|nr:DsbA family protein [Deltaproteobacteria bacterium]